MVDVEGYLREKGVEVKPASSTEVHVNCFFCGEPDGKRGRLYINIDPNQDPPGLFMCHLCGETGAINKIRKHFGDPVLRDDEESAGSLRRHDCLQVAAAYYHDCLADHEDVYKYLREERGLTIETITKHKIGYADGTLFRHLAEKGFSKEDGQSTGLIKADGHDFLHGAITIPYHVQGSVSQIRGKKIGGKYLTPPGQQARLFNSDATWQAKSVILTEGEFDALVVEQMGYHAAGVPGAISWQDGWNNYFEHAAKVYVVFDNDSAGERGAEKVAGSLGAKARVVRMPEHADGDPKNDPTEWIVKQRHTKEEFQHLLVASKSSLILTVDDGYTEWAEVKKLDGLRLGFEGIDSKIKPGILPGQLMVVLAKTGTGKTVWTLNVFQRMMHYHPSAKILFVSLEQTRGEWFERARRMYRFYNPDASDRDCLPYFRDRLMMVDKNRVTEEDLSQCIEQFELEMGQKPDLVAIDYLGYWARSYKGEPYERTSKAVMALKAIAKDQRIAILAPHQVSRMAKFGEEMESDVSRDSGVVEETADFMLGLWSEDTRKGLQESEKTGRVYTKILKSRHGGSGAKISMQFAPQSLVMIPTTDDPILVERARAEHEYTQRGDDFETVMYRHVTGDDRSTITQAEIEVWRQTLGMNR